MKTAVVGVGNMGSKYASLIFDRKIAGMELAALTRGTDGLTPQLINSGPGKKPLYPYYTGMEFA